MTHDEKQKVLVSALLAILSLWSDAFSTQVLQLRPSFEKKIIYHEGKVETLKAHPLHLTEIVILPGDNIESIQGGDASFLSVSVSQQRGDRLFLKPRLKQGDTNLLIEGRKHEYWLHVVVDASDATHFPYRLQWIPSENKYKHHQVKHKAVIKKRDPVIKPLYALGDNRLFPDWFYTDAIATYYHWKSGTSLPAVYASSKPHGPFHLINFRIKNETMLVLEKAPYWRFVSGIDGCLELSEKRDLLRRESSFWHQDRCFQDLNI